MRTIRRICAAALIAVLPTAALALDGALPIYVDDGAASRCIDASADSVWITLRRLIVNKPPNSWFTRATSMAVYLNPTIRTADSKALSFPLLTKESYQAYAAGQVSLPIEYTVVEALPLKQNSVRYTGVHMNILLLNQNSRNTWGHGLVTLADVTKKLPIPSNPYTQAAGYLLDFTNKVIDQDVADLTQANAADMARSGELDLKFSPTSACTGDFAKTGTAAILQATGPAGPGHIDLAQIDDYCFKADLTPAFVLKSARKPAGGTCKTLSSSQFSAVSNNYIAFYINAVKESHTLGGQSREEMQTAETRCINNGQSRARCLHGS